MITTHSALRTHLADALEWAEKHFSGGNRIRKGIQGGRNCMYRGTEAGSGVGSRGDWKGLRLESGNLKRPHQLSRPEVVAFGMGQRIPGKDWFQRV